MLMMWKKGAEELLTSQTEPASLNSEKAAAIFKMNTLKTVDFIPRNSVLIQ